MQWYKVAQKGKNEVKYKLNTTYHCVQWWKFGFGSSNQSGEYWVLGLNFNHFVTVDAQDNG